jgi:FHA domain
MPTTCPAGHETASTDFCDVCGMRVGVAASVPAPVPAETAASPDGRGQHCPRCGAEAQGQFCEVCGHGLAAGPAQRPPAPAASVGGPGPPASAGGPVPAAPGPAASTPAAPGPEGPDGSAQGLAAPPLGRAATTPGYVATLPSQVTGGPAEGAVATAEWTAVATADRAYFDSVVDASGPDAAAVQFPAYCPERRFRLFGPEMRIGRCSPSRGLEPEIDLTGPPTDPGISHLHAVLIADEDGGWTVYDPGSANGTQVNGREMAPGSQVRLRGGDRISLGAWTVLTIHVA